MRVQHVLPDVTGEQAMKVAMGHRALVGKIAGLLEMARQMVEHSADRVRNALFVADRTAHGLLRFVPKESGVTVNCELQ